MKIVKCEYTGTCVTHSSWLLVAKLDSMCVRLRMFQKSDFRLNLINCLLGFGFPLKLNWRSKTSEWASWDEMWLRIWSGWFYSLHIFSYLSVSSSVLWRKAELITLWRVFKVIKCFVHLSQSSLIKVKRALGCPIWVRRRRRRRSRKRSNSRCSTTLKNKNSKLRRRESKVCTHRWCKKLDPLTASSLSAPLDLANQLVLTSTLARFCWCWGWGWGWFNKMLTCVLMVFVTDSDILICTAWPKMKIMLIILFRTFPLEIQLSQWRATLSPSPTRSMDRKHPCGSTPLVTVTLFIGKIITMVNSIIKSSTEKIHRPSTALLWVGTTGNHLSPRHDHHIVIIIIIKIS